MVRSFPDFWKLNCSHHRRTGILTVDLWHSVVTCVPWAWHLDFEYLWPSQTSSFPYHVVSEGSNEKDVNCVWWTALRNHERWIWNCILTFIFSWPITACASGHLHVSSLWNWPAPCEDAHCPVIWSRPSIVWYNSYLQLWSYSRLDVCCFILM